jgi:hypothetical protein
MVIEFKYYSNAEFKKLKTPIEDFNLQPEDTEQIAGIRGRAAPGIPGGPNLPVCYLLYG